eukprot:scaffold98767_cov32-Tisochrysis_lutea.AAC.9
MRSRTDAEAGTVKRAQARRRHNRMLSLSTYDRAVVLLACPLQDQAKTPTLLLPAQLRASSQQLTHTKARPKACSVPPTHSRPKVAHMGRPAETKNKERGGNGTW